MARRDFSYLGAREIGEKSRPRSAESRWERSADASSFAQMAPPSPFALAGTCLLYTSDAADE